MTGVGGGSSCVVIGEVVGRLVLGLVRIGNSRLIGLDVGMIGSVMRRWWG